MMEMSRLLLKRGGLIMLMLTLALSAGCSNSNDNEVTTKGTKTHGKIMIKESAFPTSNQKISAKIAKDIANVKGVKAATVVVHNTDTIIGLDVKKGSNKKKVEDRVAKRVRQADPGYTVHVTSDHKLHAKLKEIHSNMVPLDGHPVHNFSVDVHNLIEDMKR